MTKNEQLLAIAAGLAILAGYLAYAETQTGTIQQTTTDLLNSGINVMTTAANSVSDFGLNIIRDFEGFSSTPYRDANGWSIGYGHFLGISATTPNITWSLNDAENALSNDTKKAQAAINGAVSIPLTQNQFDALTSLIYNIGVNAFRSSTLLTDLNHGNIDAAANQFDVWRMSEGKVNNTLVARRAQEKALFLTA